jgi:hypothetical protein
MRKLDACINGYNHQLTRLAAFTKVIQSVLDLTPFDSKRIIGVKPENVVALEVFQESCFVLITIYLEEYLTSLVGVAIINYPDLIRQYLRSEGSPDEKKNVDMYTLRQLTVAGQKRVSFKDRAKRLERIFDVMFGFSPWPDNHTASTIRDLVRVRNILVHSGGWPEISHFKDMETPGIVVSTRESDDPEEIEFFKLKLYPFLRNALQAILTQARYVQESLGKHELYK